MSRKLQQIGVKSRAKRRSGWNLPTIRFESNQSGQAIVLIALTLVLLIGMAALAIDGGGVLFLRRDAQNAADAAALAANREDCVNEGETEAEELTNDAAAIAAGKVAAAQNGFTDGKNDSRARNVVVTVDVHPDTLPSGYVADEDELENFTVVTIEAIKPSYFAHLLFKDNLAIAVQAVTQCTPAQTRDGAKGLVGIGTNCAESVEVAGSSTTITGGVKSNTECKFTGSSHCRYLSGKHG
jgi:Flp pilus assembly protein TadG